MGIINSTSLWEHMWAQEYSRYRVRVVQYSRGVHETMICLNLLNVLSKWYFLCSKPKKTKLGSKCLPPHTGKTISVLWGQSAENRKGGTFLTSVALRKATACSGRKYLYFPRLFALKTSVERSVQTTGCQCLLYKKTFRGMNDVYSDTDFSSTAFDVGRQWNNIIEMI